MIRVLTLFVFSCLAVNCSRAEPGSIRAVEKMPNLPPAYQLRDWKKTAHDFDRLVFDFDRQGEFLPLPWWDDSKVNSDLVGFALPAYLGDFRQTPKSNNYDAITCLGAILGATKAGIDKSAQNGRNWAEMVKIYYSSKNGTRLYMNNPGGHSGQSFWYEILPSLLFYQIFDHYRSDAEMKEQFLAIAERWREGCEALGATETRAPDFDHTAFNFSTGQPFDNPKWKEPDAAAGVAWLEYMAFAATGEKKFLQAANWALQFLDERRVNPLYEILMPYGAYAAARMNAEQGTSHQADKLINWVFDGDNPRKWGVITEAWNGTPVHGLMGSVYPTHEYAFTMNSFLAPAVMAPIARYDDRYAAALGKWILNVAANSRYFYPNAWKPDQQTSWDWAAANDPDFSLAYEGLRKKGLRRDHPVEEKSVAGKAAGSLVGLKDQRRRGQKLTPDKNGALEQIWKFQVPEGEKHTLVVEFRPDAEGVKRTLKAFVGPSASGPWRPAFTKKPGKERQWTDLDEHGEIYLRLVGEELGNKPVGIEDAYVNTHLDLSPHASGDPQYLGWGATDLGLYGSAFVGLLGALVEPTDVEGILKIDTRATDSFAPPSFPTYLFYNPYQESKTVKLEVGAKPVRVYDAVSNRDIVESATGQASVTIPPGGAVLAVLCPAGKSLERQGTRTVCDGVVVDYR